jgi:hypothetical protein
MEVPIRFSRTEDGGESRGYARRDPYAPCKRPPASALCKRPPAQLPIYLHRDRWG